MKDKRPLEVISVGIFVVILGGWTLFANGIYLFPYLSKMIDLFGFPKAFFSVLSVLVLPICFIIGGIAFLLLRGWGKVLVLLTLGIDLLLRLFGIINFWYVASTMKQPPVIPEGEGVVIRYFSMIPSYIMVVIEIIALYLISRPKIKKLFMQQA